MQLSDPEFSGSTCTATLAVHDIVNGSTTSDGQWTAMGHVLTRVDAAGQTTNYTYDTYNRLATVARHPNQYSNQPADACQSENYYYDTGVFGFASGASWGKLTGISFANGSSGFYSVCPGTAQDGSTWGGITYAYAYSSAGQVTGKQMGIGRSGTAGASLTSNWTIR